MCSYKQASHLCASDIAIGTEVASPAPTGDPLNRQLFNKRSSPMVRGNIIEAGAISHRRRDQLLQKNYTGFNPLHFLVGSMEACRRVKQNPVWQMQPPVPWSWHDLWFAEPQM